MTKILVYVDGENVTASEASFWLKNIREGMCQGDVLLGRFYGNPNISEELKAVCYQSGLDYVDTSSILSGQKNIADMKLTVDCLCDALLMHRNELSCVYILSKDHDYTPLIYKLSGYGVMVDAPLYDISMRCFTIGDINTYLLEKNWDPITQGSAALENQFCALRSVLPEEYDDSLIDSYLDRKRRKFLHSLEAVCENDTLAHLMDVPIRRFCFADVVSAVRMDLVKLVRIYMLKFFGVCYKDSESMYFVNKYLAGLQECCQSNMG